MEVGPLARVLVAYASGVPEVKATVDFVLGKLGAPASALFSTLGRTAARGVDCLILARKNELWLDQLADNLGRGILDTFNKEKWDPATWPREAQGFGYHEAPRGALGHWIRIENQKIANYQAVVPSTWNAGPRDPKGQPGPYEVGPGRHADRRSATTAGDPAHDPLLRPLPGLRGARARRHRHGDRQGPGALAAVKSEG